MNENTKLKFFSLLIGALGVAMIGIFSSIWVAVGVFLFMWSSNIEKKIK